VALSATSRSLTLETLGGFVDAEIAALPKDMQASFLRLAERIGAVGLERIGEPHVRHLQDKLWEMRFGGRDGNARAIYVTAVGRRAAVVHAFVKMTQKTPDPPSSWRHAEQRRAKP